MKYIIEIQPILFNNEYNVYSPQYFDEVFKWYQQQTIYVFEAINYEDKYINLKLSLQSNGNIWFEFDSNESKEIIKTDFEFICDPDTDGNSLINGYMISYSSLNFIYKCKSIIPQ